MVLFRNELWLTVNAHPDAAALSEQSHTRKDGRQKRCLAKDKYSKWLENSLSVN